MNHEKNHLKVNENHKGIHCLCDQVYRQTFVISMGLSILGLLADTAVDNLEKCLNFFLQTV